MGVFESIRAMINANIKKNGNQEITGSILNSVMTEMVDATDVELTELSERIEEKEILIEKLQKEKVDKEEGKGLSSNNYTDEDKEKLAGLENYDDTEIQNQMTELSERIVENEVLIEDLQNTKIDKEADDYYPQLSVGLADNLAGVDEIDSEISFRRSGGGAISDGTARIEAIKGNSVVWNQSATSQGEVIHMNAQSLESVGVNQWDEEWELGTIKGNDGTIVDDSTKIRTKNLIRVLPNKEYHFTQPSQLPIRVFLYGADKAYKAYEYITSSSFLMPSDVHYIKVVFEYATYNHDICINLSDASINGNYFPYIKRTQSLAIIGKSFPEGMRSAGTAHDEIRYNKATQKWEKVQRIGEVDLGTLTYAQSSRGDNIFYSVDLQSIGPREAGKMLCDRFVYGDVKDVGRMSNDTIGTIYFNISPYTDAASFKAAMQGVILYYELAEPIVTEIEGDFNLDYEVWNGGTEEILSDVPTTPLKADIAYGFNAIGKIKELEEKLNNGGGGGVSKDYVDGKLTELSAEMGKKQDTITDLETIRSGAAKGATAIQEVKTINGQSIVGSGNIEIQGGGGGGMTTPSGDPMHYMYEAVGAEWNGTGADIEKQGVYGDTITHKAGYWYLNELGDITTEEMRAIYVESNPMVRRVNLENAFSGGSIRTNIAIWDANRSTTHGQIPLTSSELRGVCYYAQIEIFAFIKGPMDKNIQTHMVFSANSLYKAFENASKLSKIIGCFNCQNPTDYRAFINATMLKEIRLLNLKNSFSFADSPLLSKNSVLFAIQNAKATSAITITLHADAYARLAEDADIVAALAEKEFVSLASA